MGNLQVSLARVAEWAEGLPIYHPLLWPCLLALHVGLATLAVVRCVHLQVPTFRIGQKGAHHGDLWDELCGFWR